MLLGFKRMSTACSLLVLALVPVIAWSADSVARRKLEKCSAGNMIEMNECISLEYVESDQRLNVVYRTLSDALLHPDALRKAQRAWIAFRDLHCGFEVPTERTGSGAPYSRNVCLIGETERRIEQLESVRPCNGCVEFKPAFYGASRGYEIPAR